MLRVYTRLEESTKSIPIYTVNYLFLSESNPFFRIPKLWLTVLESKCFKTRLNEEWGFWKLTIDYFPAAAVLSPMLLRTESNLTKKQKNIVRKSRTYSLYHVCKVLHREHSRPQAFLWDRPSHLDPYSGSLQVKIG